MRLFSNSHRHSVRITFAKSPMKYFHLAKDLENSNLNPSMDIAHKNIARSVNIPKNKNKNNK